MKLKLVLAASAAVFAAPIAMSASAQQANIYVNGGYTKLDGDGAEVDGLTGRLGVGFGRYFAVEGEATFGLNDDNGVELDNQIGLFGVGKIPLNNTVTLFGRAGVSRTETSPGGDDDGIAYGVGAEFNLTEKDGIRLDATRHDYDAGDADAYSISYVRRF
jgi:outer membrane immunogenic protein